MLIVVACITASITKTVVRFKPIKGRAKTHIVYRDLMEILLLVILSVFFGILHVNGNE